MNPHATEQTISWFKKEKKAKTLDLAPDFQRKYVWQDKDASYLIDTILNGLPFPEVYIRNITDEDGNTKYEVVDGQQRITSILRFAEDEFALDGEDVAEKLKGKYFKDLSKTQKEKFWAYKVCVRELGTAEDGEIRDLFRRINKFSATPTDQELRHAHFSGHFIKLMEDIADDEWWTQARIVTTKQIRRMDDIEYVSELFIGVMAGPQNKKDSIDRYYEEYESEFDEKEVYAKIFRNTKALIVDVLPQEELRRWTGKSDFYTLFLAFSEVANDELTASRKNEIRKTLAAFRDKVDVAKQKDAKPAKDKDVAAYVDAVTRAASDADRRTTRLKIVRKLIGLA